MSAADRDLLVAAAREAGALALRYHRHDPRSWQKAGGSVVTEADIAVDRLLAERLRAARPGYGWRSEEDPEPTAPGNGPLFVVDPIDGTRDFIAGGKEWTISLAVMDAGRPSAGVVFAPVLDELFAGSAGGGVTLNGARLRTPTTSSLTGARIAGPRRYARAVLEAAGVAARAVRFVPSLAYRLTLVAAGQVDVGIAGPGAHDWDLAAADLLVHEAGAVLTGLDGGRPIYGRGHPHPVLVAAPAAIGAEVRDLIAARLRQPQGSQE